METLTMSNIGYFFKHFDFQNQTPNMKLINMSSFHNFAFKLYVVTAQWRYCETKPMPKMPFLRHALPEMGLSSRDCATNAVCVTVSSLFGPTISSRPAAQLIRLKSR